MFFRNSLIQRCCKPVTRQLLSTTKNTRLLSSSAVPTADSTTDGTLSQSFLKLAAELSTPTSQRRFPPENRPSSAFGPGSRRPSFPKPTANAPSAARAPTSARAPNSRPPRRNNSNDDKGNSRYSRLDRKNGGEKDGDEKDNSCATLPELSYTPSRVTVESLARFVPATAASTTGLSIALDRTLPTPRLNWEIEEWKEFDSQRQAAAKLVVAGEWKIYESEYGRMLSRNGSVGDEAVGRVLDVIGKSVAVTTQRITA